jgi:hypothetical protein
MCTLILKFSLVSSRAALAAFPGASLSCDLCVICVPPWGLFSGAVPGATPLESILLESSQLGIRCQYPKMDKHAVSVH